MLVKGKTILLTGASAGIGEMLAYELARRGAKLILVARNEQRLAQVKRQCERSEQHVLALMDLRDYKNAAEHSLRLDDEHGPIDILINNAGISQRCFVKDTEIAVDEQLMAVNYFAPVALTKALLPQMLSRKQGQIVTVSSIAGIIATPYRSGYSAAKSAIMGFMDALRAETWRENLVVTLLCPGFIRTGISVNALTGDGSSLGFVDSAQASGMDPQLCAKKMVDAIEKNKHLSLMGGKEKYAVYLKRFFPKLVAQIIRTAKVR